MSLKNSFPLILFLFCFFIPLASGADLPDPEQLEAADVTVMAPVIVTGTPVDAATGKSTLTAAEISRLPKGNGSINELLKVLPSVQFSEQQRSSLQGGEILPPNVSISGGRPYQNTFLIDGIGNDSLLDPTFSSQLSLFDVASHPEEIFLAAHLVDEISVYRFNVPAKYGNFTGGVVDATTRRPEPVFGGRLFYRTTRDEWTDFHVDRESEKDFEESNNASQQPKFTKHHAGVDLDIPVSERFGLLASYIQNYSKLPLSHIGRTKKQTRRNENFFLKGAWDIAPGNSLDFSIVHAPYRAELFKPNTKNSDFTISGGGTTLGASFTHQFDKGILQFDAAYQHSENTRNAPTHHYSWLISEEKDWGNIVDTGTKSFEGGFGDIEKTQEGVEFQADLDFDPVVGPLVTHEFNAGIEFERVLGTYHRKETSYIFSSAEENDNVLCDQDPLGCVENEQFFFRRTAYDAAKQKADINTYGIYLEDNIRLWRLTLRPGLRFSYDDFMHNGNLAPRLAVSLDLFGNGGTLLIGGWNRYYGKTLLTYKLREGWPSARVESRSKSLQDNRPAPWPDPPTTQGGKKYQLSQLETPYADESVVGVDQDLFGGRILLAYVRRDGKEEFSRTYGPEDEEGDRPWVLNNNGSSRHQEYSASWERRWDRHYLALNATYQKTETSSDNYEVILDDETLEEKIWYDGKLYKREELPREDFNRPWVANFTYSLNLPWNFIFTNFTKYRSGYEGLETIKKSDWTEAGVPEDVDRAYRKEKQPESWIFDWKIDWRRPLYRQQELVLSLEVNNVFNQKVLLGESDDTFEMGRQFWVGVEYSF